jgi:hypothetical protein
MTAPNEVQIFNDAGGVGGPGYAIIYTIGG